MVWGFGAKDLGFGVGFRVSVWKTGFRGALGAGFKLLGSLKVTARDFISHALFVRSRFAKVNSRKNPPTYSSL